MRDFPIRLGYANHPDVAGRPVCAPCSVFRQHAFLCGKTGAGKTVTLINWCLQLAENLARDPDGAPGFSFIDPHGDAVQDLLARLPEKVADRVHVLHFQDTPRPRGFNILEAPDGHREAAVGAFVAMLRDLFPGGTGYRMEHILKNALLTLAKLPNQTILSLMPLLASEIVRQGVLRQVDDPVLENFWQAQFPALVKRNAGEVLGPIYNKLGAFATYPAVRRVVGQPRSTVDPLRVMNEGHILLCDLSGAGEDTAPILGAALVNRFHFSALSRAGQPQERRRLHVLFADEIHNYATPVMANILSEDRKFGLGFVLATQYFDRIPEAVLAAVLGNVNTLVALALNRDDAVKMVKYMPGFTPDDLVMLPERCAVVSTRVRGTPTVFTMVNDYPPPPVPGSREVLMRISDERDGVDAARVDAYLRRLLMPSPQQGSGPGEHQQS